MQPNNSDILNRAKQANLQGLAWIEVKAYEPFDLNSSQWLGNPGHYKGVSTAGVAA